MSSPCCIRPPTCVRPKGNAKRRYAEGGIEALDDRPRSGRPKELDEVAIVLTTLEEPPEDLGVTHWSSRLFARERGSLREDRRPLLCHSRSQKTSFTKR